MTAACQKNRVQFMDGVMFMHNPRLRRLREILDDGKTIGPIRRIMSVSLLEPTRHFLMATSASKPRWNRPGALVIWAGIASALPSGP
jgi:predicted dehydrogenase